MDRGYAWVILFACSLMQLIGLLVTFGSIGTLFVEISNRYPEASKTDVSVLASIQLFVNGIGGRYILYIYSFMHMCI